MLDLDVTITYCNSAKDGYSKTASIDAVCCMFNIQQLKGNRNSYFF